MMNQTQKHTTGKKLLALLLALIMILSLLPTSVLATGSDPTVVIAGSDFQARNGNAAGATIVNGVIDQIKADPLNDRTIYRLNLLGENGAKWDAGIDARIISKDNKN